VFEHTLYMFPQCHTHSYLSLRMIDVYSGTPRPLIGRGRGGAVGGGPAQSVTSVPSLLENKRKTHMNSLKYAHSAFICFLKTVV